MPLSGRAIRHSLRFAPFRQHLLSLMRAEARGNRYEVRGRDKVPSLRLSFRAQSRKTPPIPHAFEEAGVRTEERGPFAKLLTVRYSHSDGFLFIRNVIHFNLFLEVSGRKKQSPFLLVRFLWANNKMNEIQVHCSRPKAYPLLVR